MHFEYSFEQFGSGGFEAGRAGTESIAGVEHEVIETDVVIVGSGCGGGVCAKNIAEAGHKVLVVDKGYYFSPSQLPMSEKDGGIHLYVDGGVVSSDDASMLVFIFHTSLFTTNRTQNCYRRLELGRGRDCQLVCFTPTTIIRPK